MHSVDDNKSFKDQFFDLLKKDYEKSHPNSIIYKYKKAELESALERVKNNITSLDKATAATKLCYYYEAFNQSHEDIDHAIEYIIQSIIIVNKTYKPFLRPDTLKVVTRYFAPYAELISNSKDLYNKASRLTEVRKCLDNLSKTVDNKSVRKSLYKAFSSNIAYINSIHNLHGILIHNSICNDVAAFFYDNSIFKSSTGNTTYSGRVPRVDKTIALIEMAFQDDNYSELFHGMHGRQEWYKEACKNLFETIIKKGKEDSIEKWEYYNIFVPLMVDKTGISLCIVGKDYFESYYEETKDKQKSKIYNSMDEPCALVVLSLNDVVAVSDITGQTASISFETRNDFFDFKLGKITIEEYFDAVYLDYLNKTKETMRTIRQINQLTKLPDSISIIFKDFFSADY